MPYVLNPMLAERSVSTWAGWLLALVRLGVANVRWACAAPRIATPRLQMPIAANVSGVVAVAGGRNPTFIKWNFQHTTFLK